MFSREKNEFLGFTARPEWVESNPAAPGNPSFHPRVGVRGAHHVEPRNIIEIAGLKACRDSRRYTLETQHYGHRGSEVLAITFLPDEKEIGQRVSHSLFRTVKHILEISPKVALDRERAVERRAFTRPLPRQRKDSGIDQRQFQVTITLGRAERGGERRPECADTSYRSACPGGQ